MLPSEEAETLSKSVYPEKLKPSPRGEKLQCKQVGKYHSTSTN